MRTAKKAKKTRGLLADRQGRMKETRHGTRHFTTWRPVVREKKPC